MKRTLTEPSDGAPKTYVSVGLPDVCLTLAIVPTGVGLEATSRFGEGFSGKKDVTTGVVTGDRRARTDVA